MYYNPVKVVETNNWREECSKFQEKLKIYNPLIITSNGNLTRQKLSTVFNSKSTFSDIMPNPTFESCQEAINFSQNKEFDGVITIGGGSVMDTAKTVMAFMGTGISDIAELIRFTDSFENKVPSIFIPTTHGTGGEVTMWGTVWEMKEKKKYSISHPDLYPDIALLDGNLTLSLPIDISLSTLLDALSHSFEAIWNKNANPTSTDHAIEAICLILNNYEGLKEKHQNPNFRKTLLRASNIAGLAFSNTKTAAAHSISYPLTINYDIPHGVASALPLLPLLEINKRSIESELKLIIKKLKLNDISELEERIKRIPGDILKFNLQSWGVSQSDISDLIKQSFTKGRMDNNIVDLTKSQVRQIIEKIY